MALIEKLQQVLDEAVASGEECGCQLAVYQHGKQLCSLCAGFTERLYRIRSEKRKQQEKK